jgi:putative endopeptidase
MPASTLKPLVLATAFALAASQSPAHAGQPSTGPAPVYDVGELDPAISACQDFNAYANGKWVGANPIPADRTRWGAFDQLREQSLEVQHRIVDAADAGADKAAAGSIGQKIGWLYRSGMDEAAIDRAGFDPIKPDLAAIAKLDGTADIVAWLGQAHARGEGQGFRFRSGTDFKDASIQIAFAGQGGLGLPTPDYYPRDEHKDIRAAYLAHIAKLFELTGVPAAEAATRADGILAFETRLAKASLSRVELRDPKNQYHFMTIDEANQVTPHFDWAAFFQAIDVPVGNGFSLSQPKFFAQFDAMLADVPAAQWRDYLTFHAIDDGSQYLSRPFQEANFAFYGQTLNGQPEQRARWKRVLEAVNGGMGEALGQLYVKDSFPPEAKARAQQLVDNVRNALKARIEGLAWMSDETKARALEKWSTFLPKIGYPDKWIDYSAVVIDEADLLGNVERAHSADVDRHLDEVGKPVDREKWLMTPQTVNAYYHPLLNEIVFPAAILQPPFFTADADDAVNYGGIGAVIGHEIGHGFDDQGSQYDGSGLLRNWWTEADRTAFEALTSRLVAQFDALSPAEAEGHHVNGRLTLGENIGDLGGLTIAYKAYLISLGGQEAPVLDGLTGAQRFFASWAASWRQVIRSEEAIRRLATDPHSPNEFRTNNIAQNLDAFHAAFETGEQDGMWLAPEERVSIW